MPEDNTTFADRLNRTKEKMGELTKKAGEATKKATQATGDFLEKTSNQIQTAVEDTKSKIEEKREKRLQEKKEALIEDELMGDALSMDTLPFHNEELAQINQNQNEVISELTEHMIMLSNRVDQLQTKIQSILSPEMPESGDSSNDVNIENEYENAKSERAVAGLLQLLGASLIWVVILFGIDSYLLEREIEIISTYPSSIIIWGLGAWLWGLYVLYLVGKNVPALKFSTPIRMQISLSLGFITSISIILSTDYINTVSNIWMWGLIISGTAILGGSMIASAWKSTKKVVKLGQIENPDN